MLTFPGFAAAAAASLVRHNPAHVFCIPVYLAAKKEARRFAPLLASLESVTRSGSVQPLAIIRAKEGVLHDDLFTLRSLIDQYTLDKQEAPQALQDLVEAGYLRQLPVDPLIMLATGTRKAEVPFAV